MDWLITLLTLYLIKAGQACICLARMTRPSLAGKGYIKRFHCLNRQTLQSLFRLLFAKDGAPQEAHIGIHFIKDGVIARQSWLDIPASQITDKYQRFSISAKHNIPFDEITVMLYVGYDKIVNLYVTDVQLEIGNVMTDFRLSDEDVQETINSKADQRLTQDQLNALAEKAQLHDIELKAKATMDQFSDLEKPIMLL